MRIKKITVLGGSGFVGSSLIAKLDAAGYAVTVLTRKREAAKHLILLPNVNVVECNVLEAQTLKQALKGADAVINLIGILHQSRRLRFDVMHHQLPLQIARTCVDLGIKRLIHMSSLQASANAPSEYLRSKAAGEAALASYAKQLNITIFKPSIIFGRDDRFVNLFASLVKCLPFILLARPNAKFQPIWVEDVASCFASSIQNSLTYGQTYELAGPKVYTFRALVRQIMQTFGIQRPIIGLGDRLSYAQGFMMECLPVQLMSRDNVRSMQVDSVSANAFPALFAIDPAPMEAIIPEYLVDATQRGAYDRFRSLAAR